MMHEIVYSPIPAPILPIPPVGLTLEPEFCPFFSFGLAFIFMYFVEYEHVEEIVSVNVFSSLVCVLFKEIVKLTAYS